MREPLHAPGIGITQQGFRETMKILVKLLAQGYVRGDSHLANFMRTPVDSQYLVVMNIRVIMIDRDIIMRLPNDKSLDKVVKVRALDNFNAHPLCIYLCLL